jgi:hypothetical protein
MEKQRNRGSCLLPGCKEWSRLPRKFLTSWIDVPRCRGRANFYGHDLTRELQLIGFNLDRAAVQLGVSLSWRAAAQGMVWCPSYLLGRNRCDQVVASGSGAG